ncbi:vitamin K epoxide reductase family protein [Sphingobacterium sp. SG20118]|uniref:vitamin K epoxide reductase family protein n=1 Tax=Sphingobacterium sp. SG20118 TaxID=3367156 RepID=UPI0037DFC82C
MGGLMLLNRKKYSDLYYTSAFVLGSVNVRYTKLNLQNLLEAHIDYPSLLSLKDVLAEYNVISMAVRKGNHTYGAFETPFICSIQQEDWSSPSFTVVTSAGESDLTYLDPLSQKLVNISITEFEKIDKEVILLIDGGMAKDEINYSENKRLETTENVVNLLPLYLLIAVFVFSISNILMQEYSLSTLVGTVFLLTSLLGVLVSSLLIRHDINAYDPFVREVCGAFSEKLNCTSVLSSKQSTFFGISWSVWGLSFFTSFFVSQVIFIGQPSNLILWTSLSILMSPYFIFSVYYQWRIVKQWCPLCLLIQGLIVINFLTSFVYFQYYSIDLGQVNYYHLIVALFLGLATMLLVYFAIPVIIRANDSKEYRMKLMKLRYSPSIFSSLLENSNTVTIPSTGLGILIGDENASIEIIKVCNPYCGPCSKAHPELEDIIKNNRNVRIRIIFTASGDDQDIKTAPVQHLLAIQEKFGTHKVHEALDDWYRSTNKDYLFFASKYPMNGELKQQKDKITAMSKWCDDMKIRVTPTLFINGKELPDQYGVKDLKNFF